MIKPIISNIQILKQKCDPVKEGEDIAEIIKDLEDTLATKKGYGLAAPQIGVKKQVAIVRYRDTKLDLINPVILTKTGKYKYPKEGCLSFPGLYTDTVQWMQLVLEYGYSDKRLKFLTVGAEASIIFHEYEHLMGRTILDRKWKAY